VFFGELALDVELDVPLVLLAGKPPICVSDGVVVDRVD
jgi:hypothetical protein